MNKSVSFANLGEGKWGVRVALNKRSGEQHPSPGDSIAVPKRNGNSTTVTLGPIVSRDPGAFPGPAVYYSIDNNATYSDRVRARAAERSQAGHNFENGLGKAHATHSRYLLEGKALLSTSKFHYIAPGEESDGEGGGRFSAEASSLEFPVGALIKGIALVSHKTGATRTFHLVGEASSHGDIDFWDYASDDRDDECAPTVRIYND